jgi:hypothetical protein
MELVPKEIVRINDFVMQYPMVERKAQLCCPH